MDRPDRLLTISYSDLTLYGTQEGLILLELVPIEPVGGNTMEQSRNRNIKPRAGWLLGQCTAAILALCCIPICHGIEPVVESKVSYVALFKNGYSFVIREVSVPRGATEVLIAPVPQASLGAIWFGSDTDGLNVDWVRTEGIEVEDEVVPANLEEQLKAAVGRQVTLSLYEDAGSYLGELMPLAEGYNPSEGSIEEIPGQPGNYSYRSFPSSRLDAPGSPLIPNALVRIRADKIIYAFSLKDVRAVKVNEPSSDNTYRKKSRRVVRAGLSGTGAGGSVLVSYIGRGLSWAPTHRADLLSEAEASLASEALIINDAEDIKDATFTFVAGYPHFLYQDVETPLTGRQTLAQFIGRINEVFRPATRGRRSEMVSQSVMPNTMFQGAMPEDSFPVLEGDASEDLFFHPPVRFSLDRGERAVVSLGRTDSPLRHVYTWTLPNLINEGQQSHHSTDDVPEQTPPIWHEIELQNLAAHPWTTGPAIVTEAGRPLGQDLLTYTPVGGTNRIKVTRTTDVGGVQKEQETGRVRLAYTFRHSQYDEVEVTGTLTVRNFKPDDVVMLIKKSTLGIVTSTDPEAKVEKTTESLGSVNPDSLIQWETRVPGRGEVTLTYKVKVYVSG